ncbi:MAG: tRNA uridine-5-carboxymethylaminomethyl(34) synthesis GTPase MnmE, partial [Gammaproteobacteria bacterium]|nr:tRNA uridine-5-carboxymethylaminomethyl(34) synthesis GTPase MnmE [Gammaproteobacteria bacterium]NIR98829.1 tRNA uridine-5-carboxymethylaminomethyl(34) synthesis GTPase MnmE [Gammaproteobacteria bacterium]
EDVLELHGHGGPVVMDMVVQRCQELGARPARPGEFSERAFLNDKLDLAQAEAVADLIDSGSRRAARAALRSLQGELSRRVHEAAEELVRLRIHVEAAIDFPDEEVDVLADPELRRGLSGLDAELAALQGAARQGCLLREGMSLVIAGRPNVGKSSLLNALAGRDSAIVTEVPGTTRDVLREHIQIDGLPLHVLDTAGLRETADRVERIGVERAWEAIQRADRVLLVIDDREGLGPDEREVLERAGPEPGVTVVRNKIDLSGAAPGLTEGPSGPQVTLSARTGAGMDTLRAHLKALMGYSPQAGGELMARRRHLDALARAHRAVQAAAGQVDQGAAELAAEDLRQAQAALGEITGEFTSDDLLGRIFAEFCIGK